MRSDRRPLAAPSHELILLGAQDRPKIAPRGAKIASRRPKFAPRPARSLQDRSKRPPGSLPDSLRSPEEGPRAVQERPRAVLEPSWGHLGAFRSHLGIQNVCFSLRFPILFVNSCFRPKIVSEGILEPNLRQLGSSKVVKSAPRAAKRPSRGAQERPRAAQE